MKREQRRGAAVDGKPLRREKAAALRKDQRKVNEQGRLQQERDRITPINGPVEAVQLARVMEAIEDEGDQAEHIEVDGAGRVPTASKDEKPDEEIEQGRDTQVALKRGRILLGCGDERNIQPLVLTDDLMV